MAEYKAKEIGQGIDGALVGGKLRLYSNTFDLSGQASGSKLICQDMPKDAVLVGYVLGGTSLGTATITIGDKDDEDGIKASATVTEAAMEFPATEAYRKLSGNAVYVTTGTAALPSSGAFHVDFLVAERR